MLVINATHFIFSTHFKIVLNLLILLKLKNNLKSNFNQNFFFCYYNNIISRYYLNVQLCNIYFNQSGLFVYDKLQCLIHRKFSIFTDNVCSWTGWYIRTSVYPYFIIMLMKNCCASSSSEAGRMGTRHVVGQAILVWTGHKLCWALTEWFFFFGIKGKDLIFMGKEEEEEKKPPP